MSKIYNNKSKQEREDNAFNLFAEMLIKKIETSQRQEWKQPWFAEGQLAWPKSFYGKDYHGMNAMMLMLLCEEKDYKIPVFVTHERLNSLNYQHSKDGKRISAVDSEGNRLPFVHVHKDEHSFPVFLSNVNIVHNDTKEKIRWSDYVNLPLEEQEKYKIYHNRLVYNVFNVDQTNLKEARPELYAKLEKENIPQKVDIAEGEEFSFAPLDIMIDKQLWICPIKVEELKQGESPHYSSKDNEVVLGLKSQYAKGGHPESWVNDCFHECLHSTGHPEYLDRFSGNKSKESYAREELMVEVGAALSCHRYGIPNTIKEDSIPYVQSRLSSLREKPDFIRTLLKDVKLSTSILDSKIELIRRVYIDEKEDDKLDVREDPESTIEYDETGAAHLGLGESLGADKKQGEGEHGQRDHEVSEDRKRSVHR